MVTPELSTYVQTQLRNHVSAGDIAGQLATQGWQAEDIQAAFRQAGYNPDATPPSGNHVLTILKQVGQILLRRSFVLVGLLMWTGGIIGIGTTIPAAILLALLTSLAKSHMSWYPYVLGLLTSILIFTLSGILQSWGPSAMLYAILYRRDRPGVLRSLKNTWHKIVRFWLLSVETGLIFYGIFSLMAVPVILFGYFNAKGNDTLRAISAFHQFSPVLGFVLVGILTIPLMLIAFWSVFSIPILVDEDIKPLDALVKSRTYVAGRKFSVLLYQLPAVILGIAAFGIGMLTTFLHLSASIIQTIITDVVFLVGIFALAIYEVLVYEHFRDTYAHTLKPEQTKRYKITYGTLIGTGLVVPIALLIFAIIQLQPLLKVQGPDFFLQLFQHSTKSSSHYTPMKIPYPTYEFRNPASTSAKPTFPTY